MRIGKSIITNPTEVTEKLNSYFTSTVEELVNKKKNAGNYNNLQHKSLSQYHFHPSSNRRRIESLTKGLKGKHSAGYDIPECLVTVYN